MKSSFGIRELDRLAKADGPKPATHLIWCWQDEIDTVFEAEKRAMIESGRADKNDRFIAFTWRRGDDKGQDGAAPSP